MRLALLTVCLVKPGGEKLLALHLRKIRECTRAPYTLYAGLVRPSAETLALLQAEPHVRPVPLPATELRGGPQHAFYLEQLIAAALADPVTHLITLHVDSFPVRAGWEETVAGGLTGKRVLATISHRHYLALYTACLAFRRDFYEQYRPAFHLTAEETASEAYRRFSAACPHYAVDSGAGFVFNAFRHGLDWIPLERSNRADDHGWYGSIYADAVFHLVGAYRHRPSPPPERTLQLHRIRRALYAAAEAARGLLKRVLPARLWQIIRRAGFGVMLERPSASYDRVYAQLLANPEGYLHQLRFGKTDPDEDPVR